jgi:hypothetical protein
MADNSWAFLLSRNAYRSDIDELKTDIQQATALTNNNIALLSQQLARVEANQALLAKAIMPSSPLQNDYLLNPQRDEFIASHPYVQPSLVSPLTQTSAPVTATSLTA